MEEVGINTSLEGAAISVGIRLQPERKGKERDMLFITPEGVVYPEVVGEKQRRILTKQLGKKLAARTRLIFNMPVPNLYKQVLDTAIHKVLLQQRAFHHNVFSSSGVLPFVGSVLFFDVKHFERHTAAISRLRGQLIGGMYGEIVKKFSQIPFVCPSDDWKAKKTFFLWPDRAAGWSDQFASGDSAVAPLQKELFTCIYQEVAERLLGISPRASLDWVWAGGDERLTIRNYGDDNALSGDPGVLHETLALVQEYVAAEEEVPPKFLGFVWNGERLELPISSYLEKTYLNERAPWTAFRPYPLFGWVEKRKVYTEYGDPKIASEVFPLEDKLLREAGHPWTEIQQRGAREATEAMTASSTFRDPFWNLDKSYLLSEEEKISTGLYEGLSPEETRPMIRKLVGAEWHEVMG
jgi:hypothetical protein